MPTVSFRVGIERLNTDQEAPFSLETVGRGSDVYDQQSFLEYRRLRNEVYVNQRQFLGPEHTDTDGGEILDVDDDRSIHICCFESAPEPVRRRAIGAMRLILSGGTALPVEEMFGLKIDGDAIEISRFMANHDNPDIQSAVCAELIGEALASSIQLNRRFLAVIERPFKLLMKRKGLVINDLSDPLVLSDYGNTENIAVEIDVEASLNRAKELDEKTNRQEKVGDIWARRIGSKMLEVA
jgi:N-acyl-L-homoserine lactone synthetase